MKYLLAIIAGSLLLLVPVAPAQQVPPYQGPGNGYYGQTQTWQGVLSPKDQQKFDSYYAKWLDANRKNDQDDIASNAQHMEDIMARYNIPANVPFQQIATNAVPGGYAAYPNGPYAAYPAYPNGSYAGTYPAYGWQGRLSPDDQQKFDKDYSKWLDAQRKNDQDDVANNARKMQEIMARYNIPVNVPFAAVATNGYAAAPNAPAYPNAYGYPYPAQAQRLSAKDQNNFDKAYRNWVDARRKKDVDDIQKNERKMQDIMARYNIPANVPFDQIASQGAAYR